MKCTNNTRYEYLICSENRNYELLLFEEWIGIIIAYKERNQSIFCEK